MDAGGGGTKPARPVPYQPDGYIDHLDSTRATRSCCGSTSRTRARWPAARRTGKSTVTNLLARRYGVTVYHHDYHNARGHWDRRVAASGGTLPPVTAEGMFVTSTPEQSAASAIETLIQSFEFILDDLRALVSGWPIIAEGWGLRPGLVAPILPTTQQMLVMVPTDEFRRHQSRTLERAMAPGMPVSDLELAQRNRLERDRLVAVDAVDQARGLGIRVIEVDGSVDADGVADIVADHFAPFLPVPLPDRDPAEGTFESRLSG
ncbi:MAG TPA: hypothetical protein VGF84_15260 [Micromonosporaceae bacterium]